MNELIDFSNLKFDKDSNSGSDEKYNDLYNNEWYMFKFGTPLQPNDKNPIQASYDSAPTSEFLGCQVSSILGLKTQETLIGTYRGRSVVACKDFVHNSPTPVFLREFSDLENSMPGASSTNRRTPEYDFTINLLNTHPWLEPIRDEAITRFWETLCLDSLIGNFDRHAGNWGYLARWNDRAALSVAPIYDCGSAFYPRLAEHEMERLTNCPDELRERMHTFPNVRLLIDGKRPHYDDFLLSSYGAPARRVLLYLTDRIDIDSINNLIENCPTLTPIKVEFFKSFIATRLESIILPAYLLAKEERGLAKAAPLESLDQLIDAKKDEAELISNNGFTAVSKALPPR